MPVYTYQLTNQHEISYRPTPAPFPGATGQAQTDKDKGIHEKFITCFYVLMNDTDFSFAFVEKSCIMIVKGHQVVRRALTVYGLQLSVYGKKNRSRHYIIGLFIENSDVLKVLVTFMLAFWI